MRDKEEGGDADRGIGMACVNAWCEGEHERYKDKEGGQCGWSTEIKGKEKLDLR